MRVDYDYYTNNYGGSAVSEEEFPRYEMLASLRLDEVILPHRTDEALKIDRLKNKVKFVLCELIDNYKEYDSYKADANASDLAVIKGISSETVKDHSVSFASSDKLASERLDEAYNRKSYEIIRGRLLTTGLMYRGL